VTAHTYQGVPARARARRRSRGRGWLVLFLLAMLAVLALRTIQRLPENWKPWGHVRLDQKPTSLANLQLNILARSPTACLAALDRGKVAYTKVPDRPLENGCGISNGVRLARAYSQPFEGTCGLAAALSWYQQALDNDAAAAFGAGAHLKRIDHVGSYACRNVNGAAEGPRSEHATANAIDVTGFELSGGHTVSVAHDYGKATQAGRFLALAHSDACRFFNAVLGPDYNALHHDHFHLDLGFWSACR